MVLLLRFAVIAKYIFFFAVLLAARPRHRYICLVTAVCFSIGVNRGSSSDVPQMSV